MRVYLNSMIAKVFIVAAIVAVSVDPALASKIVGNG
jgi:hypothetical protein